MPGVTSLSVLFLLLALCPLDVAGLPEDIQVMFIRGNANIFSMMDLATNKVSDLFTTNMTVSAIDYDPVNQKVYWCSRERQCYVQDYDGSNQASLFETKYRVTDLYVDEESTLYYVDSVSNIWTKKEGGQPVLEQTSAHALTVDKANGRMIFLDNSNRLHDSMGTTFPEMQERVIAIAWNPSDEVLYCVAKTDSGREIRALLLDENEERIILKDPDLNDQISVYGDVIVFTGFKKREGSEDYYNAMFTASTNGKNQRNVAEISSEGLIKPVPFQAHSLLGSGSEDQSAMQNLQDVFTWTPEIGCLQMFGGTAIKVTLTPGLEDFSLLLMDPPDGCPYYLGQFRQDIIIPGSCFVDQSVHVAIQLTEINDILGGRFFRHFLFSCSELGPDGNVMELTADSNPDKTQATASNTSYADGSFSLMVVTSANLNSGAELTSATNVIWSQHGISLVLRHRLASGSQHRTLIPAECTINSTSHPEKKTMWLSKPDMECKQEMGLIDAWTIQSQRTAMDDVTYTQLFPFDFQVGEEVTITCYARECPYVADAGQLQGKCMEAFEKYKSCGGTFQGSSPKRRREVTSLSGNGSVSWDQAASRVMSASFTLV